MLPITLKIIIITWLVTFFQALVLLKKSTYAVRIASVMDISLKTRPQKRFQSIVRSTRHGRSLRRKDRWLVLRVYGYSVESPCPTRAGRWSDPSGNVSCINYRCKRGSWFKTYRFKTGVGLRQVLAYDRCWFNPVTAENEYFYVVHMYPKTWVQFKGHGLRAIVLRRLLIFKPLTESKYYLWYVPQNMGAAMRVMVWERSRLKRKIPGLLKTLLNPTCNKPKWVLSNFWYTEAQILWPLLAHTCAPVESTQHIEIAYFSNSMRITM